MDAALIYFFRADVFLLTLIIQQLACSFVEQSVNKQPIRLVRGVWQNAHQWEQLRG
jgi:hypothetical protein